MIDVWAALQAHDRLILNTIDGVLWASNSYWAVEVADSDHPVARVLREFNVPLEPGLFDVGRSISPTTAEPADLAKMVQKHLPDLAPAKRTTLNGVPVYVRDEERVSPEIWYAIFDRPGDKKVLVNRDYLRFCEHVTPGQWHASSDTTKALVRLAKGRPTAYLMPVRHVISGNER